MPHSNGPGIDSPPTSRKITILVLLLLALFIIFVLPRHVSEPWIAGKVEDTTENNKAEPSYVSPSTAAEKTKYRQDSQGVLAQIIAIRDRLHEQHVEVWAEIDFRQALQEVKDGDEQYSYGEYRNSLDNYEQALSDLSALEELGREKLKTALAEGFEAVEALNINLATASGELALAIAAGEKNVQTLNARLRVLPDLVEQMNSGDQQRTGGQLAAAELAYQNAVDLDPRHLRAAASLSAIKTEITESNFRLHMSRGFTALDNDEFEQAESAFKKAGLVYPGNTAVAQALAQVETRESQMLVSRQMGQAADLEAQEEWQQALDMYRVLLEQDSTLTEARVRQIPTKVRAELDTRMSDVFEDPLKLANPAEYRTARVLLNDARSIPKPGEKLTGQVARLEQLLVAAVLPVKVEFQSDNLTRVTLFRVAELGSFEKTSLQLKPGRYVAAGTRKGFRDVRIEFTVGDGPLTGPVVVRCVESI